MFIVTLSTTAKQYVTGYIVASVIEYNKFYARTPNVIFINEKDFQCNALTRFIQNYEKYYLFNGKLVFDTTM